jgi:hypothetical protein
MSYAQATMRYKGYNVTVKLIGNQVKIEAPIYLAKIWAKKQLKQVAKDCKIDLVEGNGNIFISYRNISEFKEKAIPMLRKC